MRSYLRQLLDQSLDDHAPLMAGRVVDLGGKKERRRGDFSPSNAGADWVYVNLDPDTNPDYLCDIKAVPIEDESVDVALCMGVLQAVDDPQACINEAHRILKTGGTYLLYTNLVYPVHRDPYDRFRFGPDGYRHLLKEFNLVELYSLGGLPGVFGQLLNKWSGNRSPGIGRKIHRATTWLPIRILNSVDPGIREESGQVFSMGYFAIATK